MNTRLITIFALLSADTAYAGFRHPIEQTTEEAIQIQSTRLAPGSPVASQNSLPANTKAPAAQMAGEPAAAPASSSGRFLPRILRRLFSWPSSPSSPSAPASSPASTAASAASTPRVPAGTPAPGSAPASATANRGPVPKAPALPTAPGIHVPGVQLPGGDGYLPMAATPKPGSLDLRGTNRAQIHAYLRQARALRLPERTFGTDVRSRSIADQYSPALHPTPYQSFRTAYQLSLAKVLKITTPPAATQYENMVKRLDALFLGLDTRYPRSVQALWQLSESETNPKNLQARDALFGGIISQRAGWETAAANLMEASAQKRVDQQGRYLRMLWKQLDQLSSTAQVDRVVSQVNPEHARVLASEGDRANLAMAKRQFGLQTKESLAASRDFAGRIRDKGMREGLELLRLVVQIRSSKEEEKHAAMDGLKALESQGEPEIQQSARLALARAMLQRGASQEALDLYKKVTKDHKNRLEVTAEQTYAEYMTGNYQDSLGKTVGLQSPYFQYGFAPDVHLVEILSRKAMCDFGGAEQGVKRFVERYGRELSALESTLAQHKAAAGYYEELIGYASIEQPMRFQRYLLHNNTVMENQKTMNEALQGIETLDDLGIRHHSGVDRPEGWNAFANAMRTRWNVKAQALRKESAAAALAEAEYLAKRLRHTFAQVELLDLDISTAASKNYNIQSAMNFPVRKPAEAQLDKNDVHWSFQDEIWEDELDFLKMTNPSKCAMVQQAAAN